MDHAGPDLEAVMAAAKAGEPDRYLAALLAPAHRRGDLLALAAFSAELGAVVERVREPMMGEIRLQWWRDVVAGTREAGGHPVADAVVKMISDQCLDRDVLLAMTEAHAFDLYSDPMPDDVAFHGYLDKTAGAAFKLGLQLSGVQDADILALYAGRAYGAVRLLQAWPRLNVRGRNPFPAAWLASSDGCVDGQCVADGGAFAGLVARVTEDLERDRRAACEHARSLSRDQRVSLLPLAMIRPYLATIRAGVASRSVKDVGPLRRVATIARAHWFGL